MFKHLEDISAILLSLSLVALYFKPEWIWLFLTLSIAGGVGLLINAFKN